MRAIELLESVFYRERRAYLVGRLYGEQRFSPIVIALRNDDDGIRADVVITEAEHVAQVFGFTRAYFHVDLETVGDAVVFLRTLLPRKPLDEIYTVLGRAKQGKTERYRHFFRHLAAHPHERFVHADGERGMVMLVFTLPGYPLVFKVIRDRFAYPKNIARQDVLDKYQLVFKHDRVGRLVDAQQFRHLGFPQDQFAPALRDELLQECAETCSLQDGQLVVSHCYIERRLRPLNLYLREMDDESAKRAVLDYGQSIKDLARSNIFPGDLLLKRVNGVYTDVTASRGVPANLRGHSVVAADFDNDRDLDLFVVTSTLAENTPARLAMMDVWLHTAMDIARRVYNKIEVIREFRISAGRLKR